jgi:hypothetical protein
MVWCQPSTESRTPFCEKYCQRVLRCPKTSTLNGRTYSGAPLHYEGPAKKTVGVLDTPGTTTTIPLVVKGVSQVKERSLWLDIMYQSGGKHLAPLQQTVPILICVCHADRSAHLAVKSDIGTVELIRIPPLMSPPV